MLAYGLSTAPLIRRGGSRIQGSPNVSASVKKALGERSFIAAGGTGEISPVCIYQESQNLRTILPIVKNPHNP